MRFEKWNALGNDYAIFESAALPWELSGERVRALCAPHTGIGADGILLLSPSDREGEDGVVAELRIFNPDGSEAELSGNGARQAAMYLRRAGWTDRDEFTIRTKAGLIEPQITGPRTCSMEIGRAATASADFPSGADGGTGSVTAAGRSWAFQHVSIGNPQCAIAVADAGDLEALDLAAVGPEIEASELFPNRTNVSFYRAEGSRIRARIFERGVGETLSSGTGASGAAVAAVLAGAKSPIAVELDGGELAVEVSDELDVRLSGWAEPVYSGRLTAEILERLGDL
jgi:diaminopimelate epimerase